jgi:hypothetical protein
MQLVKEYFCASSDDANSKLFHRKNNKAECAVAAAKTTRGRPSLAPKIARGRYRKHVEILVIVCC